MHVIVMLKHPISFAPDGVPIHISLGQLPAGSRLTDVKQCVPKVSFKPDLNRPFPFSVPGVRIFEVVRHIAFVLLLFIFVSSHVQAHAVALRSNVQLLFLSSFESTSKFQLRWDASSSDTRRVAMKCDNSPSQGKEKKRRWSKGNSSKN